MRDLRKQSGAERVKDTSTCEGVLSYCPKVSILTYVISHVTLLCIYTDPDGVRRKRRKPNFAEFINDGTPPFVNPSAGETIYHNPHPRLSCSHLWNLSYPHYFMYS